MRLEHTGVYDAAQRNFDRIAALAITAGDQSAEVRFGVGAFTGNGTRQVDVTVDHGLGRTPIVALAVANLTRINVTVSGALSDTQVTFRFDHIDGTAHASSGSFYWLVAG